MLILFRFVKKKKKQRADALYFGSHLRGMEHTCTSRWVTSGAFDQSKFILHLTYIHRADKKCRQVCPSALGRTARATPSRLLASTAVRSQLWLSLPSEVEHLLEVPAGALLEDDVHVVRRLVHLVQSHDVPVKFCARATRQVR